MDGIEPGVSAVGVTVIGALVADVAELGAMAGDAITVCAVGIGGGGIAPVDAVLDGVMGPLAGDGVCASAI